MKSAREKSYFLNLAIGSAERIILSGQMVQHYQESFSENSEAWKQIQLSLRRIRDLSEQQDFQLVISVYPVLYSLDKNYPFANVHRRIGEYVQNLGVEFVDLLGAFSEQKDADLWVHRVDQHPNEVAHALAGQFLASSLMEKGIITAQ
jgi:hypothetical protein